MKIFTGNDSEVKNRQVASLYYLNSVIDKKKGKKSSKTKIFGTSTGLSDEDEGDDEEEEEDEETKKKEMSEEEEDDGKKKKDKKKGKDKEDKKGKKDKKKGSHLKLCGK